MLVLPVVLVIMAMLAAVVPPARPRQRVSIGSSRIPPPGRPHPQPGLTVRGPVGSRALAGGSCNGSGGGSAGRAAVLAALVVRMVWVVSCARLASIASSRDPLPPSSGPNCQSPARGSARAAAS